MNSVQKDIFKAIHEGKWLSIEYKNRNGETTKYSSGNVFLESDSIFGVTFYFRALDVGGPSLYENNLFTENPNGAFTLFYACNNLLNAADQYLASFFL